MEELKNEETSAESEDLSPEEKASREWESFEKFYKQLLVGSGVVLLMGIVLAVLMWAVLGVLLFRTLSRNIPRRQAENQWFLR